MTFAIIALCVASFSLGLSTGVAISRRMLSKGGDL